MNPRYWVQLPPFQVDCECFSEELRKFAMSQYDGHHRLTHQLLNHRGLCPNNRTHARFIHAQSLLSQDTFLISLNVAHFTPEDLSIRVNDSVLTIEGKFENRMEMECTVSRSFVRQYPLRTNVAQAAIEATLSSDGILTVTAQRTGSSRMVPIIQTGPLGVPANRQSNDDRRDARDALRTFGRWSFGGSDSKAAGNDFLKQTWTTTVPVPISFTARITGTEPKQETAWVKSPVVEKTSYKAPVGEKTPEKAPVVEKTPDKAPVGEKTPDKAPVGEKTPDKAPVGKKTLGEAPVGDETPDKAPVGEKTPDKAPVEEKTPAKETE